MKAVKSILFELMEKYGESVKTKNYKDSCNMDVEATADEASKNIIETITSLVPEKDKDMVAEMLNSLMELGIVAGHNAGESEFYSDKETIIIHPEGVRDYDELAQSLDEVLSSHTTKFALGSNIYLEDGREFVRLISLQGHKANYQ